MPKNKFMIGGIIAAILCLSACGICSGYWLTNKAEQVVTSPSPTPTVALNPESCEAQGREYWTKGSNPTVPLDPDYGKPILGCKPLAVFSPPADDTEVKETTLEQVQAIEAEQAGWGSTLAMGMLPILGVIMAVAGVVIYWLRSQMAKSKPRPESPAVVQPRGQSSSRQTSGRPTSRPDTLRGAGRRRD
jgi:hypothetical protein